MEMVIERSGYAAGLVLSRPFIGKEASFNFQKIHRALGAAYGGLGAGKSCIGELHSIRRESWV